MNPKTNKEMNISREKYHYIMALCMLAKKRIKDVLDLEKEAHKLMKIDTGSHLSDYIYNYSSFEEDEFEEVMKKMNIIPDET